MNANRDPQPPAPGADASHVSQALRVLFLGACPGNAGRIRLDLELREIEQRIDYAQMRSRVAIEQAWAVTTPELIQILLRHRPNIVHFSGHGSSDGSIILENAQGEGYAVPKEALTELFGLFRNRGLRAVVLNSCFSENQATGIAQHIEFVVGISGAIKDDSSRAFSAGFYAGLAAGETVEMALSLGRTQIALLGQPQTAAPKLIWRADADPADARFL